MLARALKRSFTARDASTSTLGGILHAQKREPGAKAELLKLREAGKVPAVINCQGDYQHVTLDRKQLSQLCQKDSFYSTLHELESDYDSPDRVLPQSVSLHPITDEVTRRKSTQESHTGCS